MPKFEKYGTDFVYTDESGGALYFDGKWVPFRYFEDGNIDILTNEKFNTHVCAFDKYREIYT